MTWTARAHRHDRPARRDRRAAASSAAERRPPIRPPTRVRRAPAPTRLGWAVLLALALLLGASTALIVGPARAEEDGGRYAPASRGAMRARSDAVQQWRPLVEEFDWPVDVALRVIACESEGSPTAVNPASGATGLFQLLGWSRLALRLTGLSDLTIPWVNVRTAYALWEDSGGRFGWHWAASAGCWR